ncbi:MAG: DUF2064 domain-containing protein [Micropepsaceae bacterium]
MARPIVFVFARAPLYGTVKSRLARDIGSLETIRFYRRTLSETCRRLSLDPRIELRLATTPHAALHQEGLWPRRVSRIDQGRGDLGQRMISVLKSVQCGPAIVIGSDIPDARPGHIAEAVRLLGSSPYVLGPVHDGGYWLIGARHPSTLRKDALKGVRWSTPFAMQDTRDKLGSVALLATTLTDVDDAASLKPVAARMAEEIP